MKCLIALALALLIIALPLRASTDENSKVSFRHDVMPVLSKAGCNGGGCQQLRKKDVGRPLLNKNFMKFRTLQSFRFFCCLFDILNVFKHFETI